METKYYITKKTIILGKAKIMSGQMVKKNPEGFSLHSLVVGTNTDDEMLNSVIKLIDFEEYFKPVSESIINFSTDGFVYSKSYPDKVFRIKSIDYLRNTITASMVNGESKRDSNFNVKDVTVPHEFWFINTNGKICSSFMECDTRRFYFESVRGNCFDGYTECRKRYDEIVTEISNSFGVRVD